MARDYYTNPVNPGAFKTQRVAEATRVFHDGFPNDPGCYTKSFRARGTAELNSITKNILDVLNKRKGFTIIQMTTKTYYPVFIRTIVYKIGE